MWYAHHQNAMLVPFGFFYKLRIRNGYSIITLHKSVNNKWIKVRHSTILNDTKYIEHQHRPNVILVIVHFHASTCGVILL